MRELKSKVKAFTQKSEELLRWARAEKKRNPEAEDIADEIILTAYERLVEAGAEDLLIASGFEDLTNKRR